MRVVVAGALTLAVAMGIGRFAYTPIFPLMQSVLLFSESHAGYLASVNYLGYLIGALLGGVINWKNRKVYYLKIHLLINIISTIAMATTTHFSLWMLFRLVSGVTSGLVFVLISSILLDYLAKNKLSSWSGFFYGGVGIGIVLTGILVPIFHYYFNWQGAWIGLGAIAFAFSIWIFKWVREEETAPTKQVHHSTTTGSQSKSVLAWLILAYGCEGLGYIITGTFLVAMIEQATAMKHVSSVSWMLVGLAAIPSCMIWALLGKRWGRLLTLKVAYVVQALGIILPVFSANMYVTFLGAVLFGGTFMGITTLAVSVARQLLPNESSKAIGYLTVAYGIGQIIGPSIAGVLVSKIGNYLVALVFASSILLLGIVFLIAAQFEHGRKAGKSVTL